jgi:large subunit ribosomal protein L27Ae
VLKLLLLHVCQVREAAAKDTSKAVVIDVTKYGLSKVLGKGQLPQQPVVVRAKFVSKLAEQKVRAVGGAVQLVA